MRQLIGGAFVGSVLLAGAALADGAWHPLAGDAATAALSGHILAYSNGATQSFSPGGDTAYDSGHLQPGRWRIEADNYCSVWPPSDHWACYKIEQSADGRAVHRTAQPRPHAPPFRRLRYGRWPMPDPERHLRYEETGAAEQPAPVSL